MQTDDSPTTTAQEHVCSTGELEDITDEEFSRFTFRMYGVFSLCSLNLEQVVAVANAAMRYKLSSN